MTTGFPNPEYSNSCKVIQVHISMTFLNNYTCHIHVPSFQVVREIGGETIVVTLKSPALPFLIGPVLGCIMYAQVSLRFKHNYTIIP